MPLYRILYDAFDLGVLGVYGRTAIGVITIAPFMYAAARLDERLRAHVTQALRRRRPLTELAG